MKAAQQKHARRASLGRMQVGQCSRQRSNAGVPAADAIGDNLPFVAQLTVGLHERTILLRSSQVRDQPRKGNDMAALHCDGVV